MFNGVLTGTYYYMIGAMEYTTDGRGWRDIVKQEFDGSGIIFLDPYHKPFITSTSEDEEARKKLKEWLKKGQYRKVEQHMFPVRSDDLRCCDKCDFAIAHIDFTVPTIGSVEEIVQIVRAKKPLFLVSSRGKRKCPLWFFGMVRHKYIYGSLETAMKAIRQIHTGKKRLDNHRWKLLKREYLPMEQPLIRVS